MSDAVERVVVFRECDVWLAQGLEHDICAHGHDFGELRNNWALVLAAERQLRDGSLAGLEEAPRRFFVMWEKAPGRVAGWEGCRIYHLNPPPGSDVTAVSLFGIKL